MRINEGKVDRMVRAGAGAALVALAAVGGLTEVWGIVMLAAAAVLLVTAASGFCPLYALLGVSTAPEAYRPADDTTTENVPR